MTSNVSENHKEGTLANLPAGFRWKTSDLHPMDGPTWTRSIAAIRRTRECLLVPGAAGELNSQAFSHEVATVCNKINMDGDKRLRAHWHERKAKGGGQ